MHHIVGAGSPKPIALCSENKPTFMLYGCGGVGYYAEFCRSADTNNMGSKTRKWEGAQVQGTMHTSPVAFL